MIWLTWRQSRAQITAVLAALALVAIYLATTGTQLHNAYHNALTACGNGGCGSSISQLTDQYKLPYYLAGGLLLLLPGVIGAFWGAPLIARELETGTHRLVWNQSITRARWLTVKLLFVGLATVAANGLLSLLVSWWSGPLDQINQNRFTPLLFDVRGVVPLGYAAFAFTLGACAGLFIRRSLPAVAATLLVFAAVQFLMPLAVRPHLEAPVRTDIALNAEAVNSANLLGTTGKGPDAPLVANLTVPNAWVVYGTTPVLNSAGHQVNNKDICASGSQSRWSSCVASAGLKVPVSYQPGDRYWTFQWYETAIYLALSAGLAWLCSWRLLRRLA
jgi:ABC-type transport system involved in multi-copper enzyme maturation permease subunit